MNKKELISYIESLPDEICINLTHSVPVPSSIDRGYQANSTPSSIVLDCKEDHSVYIQITFTL